MADLPRREFLALLAAALGSGCSLFRDESLRRAPGDVDTSAPAPPVVFVHGAFGARLRRPGGREIWPGGALDLLLDDYHALALPLDPDTGAALDDGVRAWSVFDEAAGMQFYGSVLEMLRRAGRYEPTRPGTPVTTPGRRQYVYCYDWRRDYAEAARGLDALIEQLRRDHGDPGLKVDLVAHSSGGLLARYLLLYGPAPLADGVAPRPDFAGVDKVRRLVTLGTPEIGMARAVAALVHGEPVGLRRIAPEVLATAPSAFQLLPHGYDAWLVDERGEVLDLDVLAPGTWQELGIGPYDAGVADRVRRSAGGGRAGRERLALLRRSFAASLARARLLADALWAAPLPAAVQHAAIAGDCRPTQACLLREWHGGRPHLATLPLEVHERRPGLDYDALMLAPGDGMVTAASVLASPARPTGRGAPRPLGAGIETASFVCAQHNQLVVNPQAQREILRGLAADPAPAAL